MVAVEIVIAWRPPRLVLILGECRGRYRSRLRSEWRLDNRFPLIDLDVDLDLHKQKTG